MKNRPVVSFLCASILLSGLAPLACAADWTVPLAGNVFRTAPSPKGRGVRRNGALVWSEKESVYSVYFCVDRKAELQLALRARRGDGRSTIKVRVNERDFEAVVDSAELATVQIGKIEVSEPGYVRVDLRGAERAGKSFGEIRELLVSSATEGLKLDYVKTNKGGMYYWGRRGPSVHLSYDVPKGQKLRYAYSEVTVPKGQDPIGSFYMANGFGQGYFGIQVNSERERRVLFSVWSPFKTDDPRKIPKDQRIEDLGHGEGVHVGKFGNEGSGGQSYLVYPWKAGVTYRFLTEVKPDEKGSTVYTSWFGDASKKEWKLIASFRRPKTDTNLRGFHSFLESFSPAYGYFGRRAYYGNVWVGDVDGEWHECLRARFSVDGTGRGRHRLDFTGGSEGDRFFLRNCGFFHESGRPGERFTRKSKKAKKPAIDFESLPRGKS
ncbi:MAG: DUF3472 domain-containing protein [Planctomycetota bacterium]